jgi:hypothetical protein
MSVDALNTQTIRRANLDVPQGSCLVLTGVAGIILAVVPVLLLVLDVTLSPPALAIAIPIAWAVLVGLPMGHFWSSALHMRMAELRTGLRKVGGLTADEDRTSPGRVPWMESWLGVFERGVYATLIGFAVPGAAAFIVIWIALKQAEGYSVWSKGTAYGRGVFLSELMRTSMSLVFGLSAGLVVRTLLEG